MMLRFSLGLTRMERTKNRLGPILTSVSLNNMSPQCKAEGKYSYLTGSKFILTPLDVSTGSSR